MAGNVRIYALAKELGIDSAKCIELCEELNIGTDMTASSSVPSQQADRVRHRAARDGLVKKSEPTQAASGAAQRSVGQQRQQQRQQGRRQRAQPGEGRKRPPPSEPVAEAADKVDSEDATAKLLKTLVREEASAKTVETETAETVETKTQEAVQTEEIAAEIAEEITAEAAGNRFVAEESSNPESSPETAESDAAVSEPEAEVIDQDVPISADVGSASDDASQTISSRPAPTSVSGKLIPPPPGRSRAITVDGEAFSPGVKRGRPASSPDSSETETPSRSHRRRPDRRAAHVDAVFTPVQTRLPSSAGQGKGKSGRGNAAQFRPNQQRRRKGGRRRRRSVEELRPLDQQSDTSSLADAPPPEGVVEIERASTAQEVAPKLNRTTSDMIKYFLDHQEMVTATQPLPDDLIELYAEEIGARVRIVDFEEEQEAALRRLLELPDVTANGASGGSASDSSASDGSASDSLADGASEDGDHSPRPPIVTIMGHVDHGKTTLLDAIRNTDVTSGEAGGITQHIGAYHVERNGRSITFIDTPGHEAFTAMRNRGANVTDIVVLVVAADDGLMPQTEEAIDHAKAADVPILVAINKVDLEGANADRARQQLSELGLVPEAWGGDTVMEEVSALQGEGLDELLESILLMAELQELTASMDQRSQGVVLESHKDVGRGPIATLLVREGTLKVGDPVVAGTAWGRVRALLDDKGESIQSAGPSAPVQVLGLSEVAAAGDEFAVAPSQKLAEKVGRERELRYRMSDLGRDIGLRAAGAKLEDIFTGVSAGETVTLNLVLKSDVHGSLEALVASLEKLERDNLKLSFVRRGVGGITENDVQLASASNATIIGFNVRPDSKARQMAVKDQVEMRLYEVIYKVTEDVEAALLGMLAPEIEEHVTGEAEVREVFRIRRVGMIAGCYVRSGVVKRGTQVRFLRDGVVIWRGAIRTLKRFQEDATEVAQGFECGIGLSDFQDLKQGDVIEAFEEREIAPG